jgi:hypothetical protein
MNIPWKKEWYLWNTPDVKNSMKRKPASGKWPGDQKLIAQNEEQAMRSRRDAV